MAVEQCGYKISEPNTLCQQPIFANIHDPIEKCSWVLEGVNCPSGNHHEYVRPNTHEVNVIRVENLLRDSDIIWPRYGQDSVSRLAERIVIALEFKD